MVIITFLCYNVYTMQILGKKEPVILVIGDSLLFVISLWLSLLIRNLSVPAGSFFVLHLVPFLIIFLASILSFYIGGLYGKHTGLLRSKLPNILLNTQIANSLIAVIFFYLIPIFGIAPKTLLFIYLAISSALVILWRRYGYFFLVPRRSENAIIIGDVEIVKEIVNEVNTNNIYNIKFVKDFNEASVVIADFSDENVKSILPDLYEKIFSGMTFIDIHKIYEEIFDKVPLKLLNYNWFLENVSTHPRVMYDSLKRLMDITLSSVLGVVSLLFYPFIYVAIKFDDGKEIFITQERVGQGGRLIKIHKFRTMSVNDKGDYKNGVGNVVTKVGAFLRKSRLDELPQLWNVIKGDISLIGPRPELPTLVQLYDKEIPYYNVRHIIKPGLSGWAQIYQENHPHHKEAVDETKEKLTYDLYYIKERSLLLDLKIALKTVKTLLSRVGV